MYIIRAFFVINFKGQFFKKKSSSERSILEKQPGINVVSGKELQKFTFQMNEEELK